VDPVELRRKNDTMVNPTNGAPYTSRSLMQCYDEASAAFGWKDRSPEPGSMSDGDWLVGWGCATCSYPTQLSPAAARVRLSADGKVRVQIASHDVGTGAYTVIGQMAAELLGADMRNVAVELGDSRLPPGPVAGGSVTTASSCSAVKIAAEAILRKLAGPSATGPIFVENGLIKIQGGAEIPLAKAFEQLGTGAVEELGEYVPKDSKPGDLAAAYKGSVKIVGGAGETSTHDGVRGRVR